MTSLADAVLPLIRTRADLHRWSVANAHGRDMHETVDLLEAALPTTDPVEAHRVTERAVRSALKVIARADDSSGIIGDACRRLLALHPVTAAAARMPVGKLVDWMMAFQFDGIVDYFELDVVDYAPALGDIGIRTYRQRLDAYAAGLGPRPSPEDFWSSKHAGDWFRLDWNAKRLAILAKDVDAIIATHAGEGDRAAWLEDAAYALDEIGERELAREWACKAAHFDRGHQSQKAAGYWCELLERDRPDELLSARQWVFEQWPSASTAADLHRAAKAAWPALQAQVLAVLATRPDQAVSLALHTLKDPALAWRLAHEQDLSSDPTWSELAKAYERVDPLAVLPIHARLVENELVTAGAEHYRRAARRLARMRTLAAGSAHATEVDTLIADLRRTHCRRPRLQQEFDRAHLP